MHLIDIKQGSVILELSPPDCATLVNMSRTACQHTLDGEIDLWQTWAGFFHACAVASYSQWHICPVDEQTIDDQLAQVGLRTS